MHGIRDWALAHGFVENGLDSVSCEVGEGVVSLEFTARRVRVCLVVGGRRHVRLSAHPSRAFLNTYGVVEGIELSASFLAGAAVAPPWLPRSYLDAVGYKQTTSVRS